MSGRVRTTAVESYVSMRTAGADEVRDYVATGEPLDQKVRFRQVEARFVAARRYSGRWSEANYRKHEAALLEALATDRVSTTGAPMFARYNAPFTPWFMRRNEIQIEVAPDRLDSGVVRSTD